MLVTSLLDGQGFATRPAVETLGPTTRRRFLDFVNQIAVRLKASSSDHFYVRNVRSSDAGVCRYTYVFVQPQPDALLRSRQFVQCRLPDRLTAGASSPGLARYGRSSRWPFAGGSAWSPGATPEGALPPL